MNTQEPITPDAVLRASDSVLMRTAGTETVLLDLDSEEFFGLDGVGARVFELLDEPSQVSKIVDTLLTEYEVDRETLEADVIRLLQQLAERGLVVHD